MPEFILFFLFFSIYIYANITPLLLHWRLLGSHWGDSHFSMQVLWEFSWGLIQLVQFSTQCNEWSNLQPQLKIITRQSCLWISPAFFITRNISVACYCWQLCWELSNSNKKAPPVQQLIQDLWSVWNFTPRLNVHIIRNRVWIQGNGGGHCPSFCSMDQKPPAVLSAMPPEKLELFQPTKSFSALCLNTEKA